MIETARTRALLLALALALGAGAVHAGGPVLLTVTGAVENANRGAVDPAHDKLFVSNHVAFDRAMEFDADTLAALPQATVRADFPKDGRIVSFTGPLLADVLAAAGATGATVTIQAMDGYAVEVASAAMTEKGAVVALARDGKPLGIGGFGPTQIVFPRADRADLAEMNDDWWAWQVYHIRVD
ncbi:MAG: hypothetical protein H0T41_01795 [Rhodobacteraceae bacterium]|nr:hypothetical protein [Paracoccaceae bacterium]